MVGFVDQKFFGMLPRLPAHDLPDGYAQEATNVDLRRGDLRPMRAPVPVTPFTPALVGKRGLFCYEPTKSFVYFSRKTDVVLHPTFGVDRYFTTNGQAAFETGIIEAARHPAGAVFNGDAPAAYAGAYAWPYQTLGMKAPQVAPTVTLQQRHYVATLPNGLPADTSLIGAPQLFQKYEYEVWWQRVNKDGTRQKMEGIGGVSWDSPTMPRRGEVRFDVPTGGDAIFQIKIFDLQNGRKLVGIAHSTNASDYDSVSTMSTAGTTTTAGVSASQYPTVPGFEVYDTLTDAELSAIAATETIPSMAILGEAGNNPSRDAAQKVLSARAAGKAARQATVPAVQGAIEPASAIENSSTVLEEGIPLTVKVAVSAASGANAATYTGPDGIEYTRSDIVFTMQIGDKDSRVYCYTYVNKFGEESPPSPPSVEVQPDYGMGVAVNVPASWAIGGSQVYLNDYQPGVTAIRIYRTVTGSDGSTNYHLFREIGLSGGASFFGGWMSPVWVDFLDAKHAKEALPTIGGLPAPATMQGISPYSSGVLMGFAGDELCFSREYQPYSWPIAYRVKAPHRIRAAVALSNGVLLGTDGGLFMASGATPDTMGVMRIPEDTTLRYPGFFMLGHAAAAFTTDGLSVINGATVDNALSLQFWTREQWLAWSSGNEDYLEDLPFGGGIKAVAAYNNSLFVFCATSGYVIDLESRAVTIISGLAGGVSATHYSPAHDALYLIRGGYVVRWGGGETVSFSYRSKVRRFPFPVCLRAAKVVLGSAGSIDFSIYADGVLKHSATISGAGPVSQHFIRLPSGFKAMDWDYRISGDAVVSSVHVAETMAELRGA